MSPSRRSFAALSGLLLACAACSSSQNNNPDGSVSPDGSTTNDAAPVDVPPVTTDGFPAAPEMPAPTVRANRDSVLLDLPVVAGAKDYRAFAFPAGSSVEVDAAGHETLRGTTMFCAGFRQHNAPVTPQPEIVQTIQVAGLSSPTSLVVEALDTPCPFAGVTAPDHIDLPLDAAITEDGAPQNSSFSIFTEAEVIARYGSLIINGHGEPNPFSWGGPAAPAPPRVLARTTVTAVPTGVNAPPPVATFFDDFSDENDQPRFVRDVDNVPAQGAKLFQNSRWNFFTEGAESGGAGASRMFIRRGQLQFVLADWANDIMSENVAYPRRTVQIGNTDYLHVTFEVASASTQRRYWWFGLCGADTAGATLKADGSLAGEMVHRPFFMAEDGYNPSLAGWNCLQVFPRDGSPFPLEPTDTSPEIDMRVMVNRPGTGAAIEAHNVVNLSPAMYGPGGGEPSWYRQRDAAGVLTAPMLDDQQFISPNTHFDFYIRRDRFVMYVNGQQRLCNDFAAVPLTMAEGALGFGQILYHTSAEHLEFTADYWVRTGERYYLSNTPWVDARSFDNIGYEEHVASPPGFDAGPCYQWPGPTP